MKKNIVLIVLFFISVLSLQAQLCPGGGTTFAGSVTFDQAWINGCLTGTSCNGGVEFDNRAACEPTTAMDGCAPLPSCTVNAQDGSDIWFNFYATGTTATINVIQNVSFIACIQAFSGGPDCASLVQIGCVKASGPSTGVSLALSGLTINQQYYFRVFGSASAASQRTGTFCFCGSAGLGSTALPVTFTSFKASTQKNNVTLSWTTASEQNNSHFDIEQSFDGINFSFYARVAGNGTTSSPSYYSHTINQVSPGKHYYRLKQTDIGGRFTYSTIVSATILKTSLLNYYPVPASDLLIIQSSESMQLALINSSGQLLKYFLIKPGKNELPVSALAPGVYVLRSKASGTVWKFNIAR